jgi:poly(A) polymerase
MASRLPFGGVVPDRVRALLERAGPLAERFRAAGHELYLVGGAVRDAILGEGASSQDDPVELDFTTDAKPEETEAILRSFADSVWDQGRRFGTIAAVRDKTRYEVTTHRAEAYAPESRKPDVAFADAVEVDLSRRDFTVNAMALRLPELELVDPFDGLSDLAKRRLRTPLAPEESFSDDPLRMLRAARFVARFGLEPEPELLDAIRRMRGRLRIVSPERVRDELDKLLVVQSPSAGLWLVVETGLAEEFLPELLALSLEQDPIHRHKDVLAHTIAVVERTPPDRLLRLAALFHDVGKPATRSIGPSGVSFHHHDLVGARMTRERMRALHYPNDDIDVVARLVELHLRFHTYRMGWTDRAVRRYVRDAGPLLDRLNALTRADCTTRNPAKARALARRMDELERRIAALREKEELDAIRPDLDGHEVMAELGIPPGPAVGEALSFLLELRLDEGPLGKEEARRRLRSWWAARGGEPGAPRKPKGPRATEGPEEPEGSGAGGSPRAAGGQAPSFRARTTRARGTSRNASR